MAEDKGVGEIGKIRKRNKKKKKRTAKGQQQGSGHIKGKGAKYYELN